LKTFRLGAGKSVLDGLLDAGQPAEKAAHRDLMTGSCHDALPLVLILVPASNAEEWIADTVQSAVGQAWPRDEINVVNAAFVGRGKRDDPKGI